MPISDSQRKSKAKACKCIATANRVLAKNGLELDVVYNFTTGKVERRS